MEVEETAENAENVLNQEINRDEGIPSWEAKEEETILDNTEKDNDSSDTGISDATVLDNTETKDNVENVEETTAGAEEHTDTEIPDNTAKTHRVLSYEEYFEQ